MIAIMSSVPDEGKQFTKQLRRKTSIGGKAVYQGAIGDKRIVYMISGMGKTNAAHAATILLERFSPELVILFGAGGAYPSSGLRIGDIAVAEEEIYGDEGVLDKNGFQGTEFIGIPLLKKGAKRYFNRFPLHPPIPPLVRGGKGGMGKIVGTGREGDFAVKAGVFVTVSTCTGTRKRALELRRKYRAICENMEGASVAHICTIYGTPMMEIRGVSNIVEDRDGEKWNIQLAAENCQGAVMELLKRDGKPG